MKDEKIYHQWKSHRRQVVASEHFTAEVMQRIQAVATANDSEPGIVAFDRSGRLARWGTAGGLVLLGLFRLFYILAHLLQPQLLMH